jgi:uncharacterized protein (UPF0332 family)
MSQGAGEDALWFWRHAETALKAARQNLQIDPSTASNRAYYAAFYAVSALFASEGMSYTRHTAVEAAVHRDLVNTGRWSQSLGAAYRELHGLRMAADYDVSTFPTAQRAQEAVEQAEMILQAIRAACPQLG